tara:strand:- start:3647 stop:5665 length:2019 start_codon:yes stop_codon:yes gene_type:complete
MIFSVMASPNRIDILRILNSKGPLTYSELKSLAGFKSKKESGKFAYHLRKLLRQSLVALNKSERRYTITNLGKLVLSLARQIEERSIIESGKMYVRTSHDSIEEFNSQKIIQSLVREGSLPLELSQKITEEVENRIYKFQTTYLTGSLIREMVDNVLLEHGYEEYRNKLARLGMPVFDVQEMFTNVENNQNGTEDILFKTGKHVLSEYLLTNTLPKDVADSHLSGDLHISNPGIWSLVPDTVFLNIKELIEDGLELGGKSLGVSRISQPKTLDDLSIILPMVFSLVSKEASQEVVIDELPALLTKTSKNLADIEKKLLDIFKLSSTSISYEKSPTIISFRLPLSTDQKVIKSILSVYKSYVQITPLPKIGLVIDYEKGKIPEVSDALSTIISLGGNVIFSKGSCSTNAILKDEEKHIGTSIKLGSLTINLPRLAFESNKDETYFRARLALLIKPAIDSMVMRKKDISDLTRRGINPLLSTNTQFMQKNSMSLTLNLVGLKEAVFNILGHKDDKEGKEILYKVIQTAVDVASKKGKECEVNVTIAMVDSDGISRFVTLDSEKYGKNSVQDSTSSGSYSQGLSINPSKLEDLTPKNASILESNNIAKALNGGLLLKINFAKKPKSTEIKAVIEKFAVLTSSFKPIVHAPVCGNCGYKDEKLVDKCPTCKSQYIL